MTSFTALFPIPKKNKTKKTNTALTGIPKLDF